MRRIVVAKHRQGTQNLHTGGIGRHHDHALLRMAGRIGVGFAHDDVHRATGITRTRRPPFAAIDHVMVAIAADAALNVGGVR